MQLFKNVFIAALGGVQYGYHTAVIAGAIALLIEAFGLSPLHGGLVVSVTLFGAFFGACSSGLLSNRFGRRPVMILCSILFLVGPLIASTAPDYILLLCGRFVTGLGVGISSIVIPMYLTEIAPVQSRGLIVNCNQIAMALGTLFAYFICYYFTDAKNWRLMFAIGSIAALPFLIGLFFVPETLERNRIANASFKRLFEPRYRFRIALGTLLYFFQQVTGINAALYFAPIVFGNAGLLTGSGAALATFGLGALNLIAILISFWLIDRAGRKPLLLCSMGAMTLNLLILAFFSSAAPVVSVVCLMLFMASYALGLGPVPVLLVSEMCPIAIRAHALTFVGFIGWIFNAIVALTFLKLNELITPAGTFCLYAFFGILALWLIITKMPETKGKNEREIEEMLGKISSPQ